jgi:hypothetical protein
MPLKAKFPTTSLFLIYAWHTGWQSKTYKNQGSLSALPGEMTIARRNGKPATRPKKTNT